MLNLQLSDDQLESLALLDIDKLLRSNNRSLCEFADMPQPDILCLPINGNRLIYDELNYDREALRLEHNRLLSRMTSEQMAIYDAIMRRVISNTHGLFFVNGFGGSGKTYIWRALSVGLRSQGEIVLTVASSGIAVLLIPGGRIAHSRFYIAININEDSTCNIAQGSPLAELIVQTKLFIWDKAPMIHRHCFEALDRTFRDVLRSSNDGANPDSPFGGTVVALGGDFRQILPVIPKGTQQQVVHAAINSSYLWDSCEFLNLTKNMRLLNEVSEDDIQQRQAFYEWVLQIGDGSIDTPHESDFDVDIPESLLIRNHYNPLDDIVHSTYLSILENLGDLAYFQNRATLAPTNEIVDIINEYMLSMVPGDEEI